MGSYLVFSHRETLTCNCKRLQCVKAVYPAAAKLVDLEDVMSHSGETSGVEKAEMAKEVDSEYMVQPDGDRWDPPVPVSHLLPEQQEEVRKLLKEECCLLSPEMMKTLGASHRWS